MRSFAAALLISSIAAAAFTPLVRLLALRLGAVSHPGGRHIHQRTVPRLGGLALFGAFLVPLIGLFFVEAAVARTFTADVRKVAGLFGGATAMTLVGAIDDVRGVRAVHKLLAQVFVAVLAYSCGFHIEAIELPLFGTVSMGVFALPVTVLWIVGIVNAVNLIDGLDGLAGGVVFFAALTNFVVALVTGAQLAALLSAATMGAVLGFLFHNFNPARIFMGDSGSYFLGYVLALTSLSGVPRASAAVALLVPVLALGVPIFDVLFSMIRRFLERRPIFSPDRGHIHHRLLDVGITHRRAVLILYGVCAIFAGSAIAAHLGRTWQVGLALLVASTALFGLVRVAGIFDYFRDTARGAAPTRSHDAERLRRAIPAFVLATEDVSNRAEVEEAVARLCTSAGLTALRIADRLTPTLLVAWSATGGERAQDSVALTLPLEHGPEDRLRITFEWPTEDGEVTPQTEALLQLVTDRLAGCAPAYVVALPTPVAAAGVVRERPSRPSELATRSST